MTTRAQARRRSIGQSGGWRPERILCAREGVGHLRFIDPTARTLKAFALQDGRWLLIATTRDEDPIRIPPFDAVTFGLGRLWPKSVM